MGAGSLPAIAQVPAVAMGMTYLAMAGSIGLAMQNATAAQQRGQVLAAAAVTQTLALIIKSGESSS